MGSLVNTACGPELDVFFSEDADDVSTAKAICNGCPARPRCLQAAITAEEEYGVWGGYTPTERRFWVLEHGTEVPANVPALSITLYANQRTAAPAPPVPADLDDAYPEDVQALWALPNAELKKLIISLPNAERFGPRLRSVAHLMPKRAQVTFLAWHAYVIGTEPEAEAAWAEGEARYEYHQARITQIRRAA